MKQIAAILLSATSLLLNAQCTISDLGLSAPLRIRWANGCLLPDGSMFGAAVPEDFSGDMLAIKLDPVGNVILMERYATTDPRVRLYPTKVVPAPNGGMVIFGNRFQQNCENYFAVQLDSTGQQVWARIYMRPYAISFTDDMTKCPSFSALSDGGYLMTFDLGTGIQAVRIDGAGVPTWGKTYTCASNMWEVYMTYDHLVESDGELLFASAAYREDSTNVTMVTHTNSVGDPIWSFNYELGGAQPNAIAQASNGDYLLAGRMDSTFWFNNPNPSETFLMRLDPAGGFLWMKAYGTYGAVGNVGELPNGEIIIAMKRRGYAQDSLALIHTSADGSVIAAHKWQAQLLNWNQAAWGLYGIPQLGTNLVGIRNDSLIVATTVVDTDGVSFHPRIIMASNAASLSSVLIPMPVTGTSAPAPFSITDSVFVFNDTAKTWTMALGPPLGQNDVDLSTFISSTAARPGFQMWYYSNVANGGGEASGPPITTFTFDPQLSFLFSNPPATSVVGNVITWSGQPSLPGWNTTSYQVKLQVPASAVLGTTITGTMIVAQDSTEVSLANNTSSLTRTITNSYDPNAKEVRTSSGQSNTNYIIGTDQYLDYTIQFQNTGTDTAFTVVVVDSLPLELDSRTFQLGPTSHPCTYEMGGDGIARFTFGNILLADSNTNEAASHGLINFRIKPNKPEIPGTAVTNVADIFFDFNAPIRTPEATVVLGDLSTRIAQATAKEKLLVYPVPAKDILAITMPDDFDGSTFSIIAHDGRMVMSRSVRSAKGRFEVPVGMLPPGGYVIAVQTADGKRLAARFMKE